jgi:hypothetical protein
VSTKEIKRSSSVFFGSSFFFSEGDVGVSTGITSLFGSDRKLGGAGKK